MAEKKKTETLGENLKQLAEISEWFNNQKELDVEIGLEKVRIAAGLIKSSKEKLNKLENEFKEIEKGFDQSSDLAPENGGF